MANIREYYFDGTFKYAFVQGKNKFDKYAINFYPKDDTVRKAVKATGTRCGVKEDDDGFYYVFTNAKSRPVVTDGKGADITALIGNGSAGTIKVSVEEFDSKQHGKVVRTILEGVVVTSLVPYEKPEISAEGTTELPA